MRILLVEDDVPLSRLLREGLEGERYTVESLFVQDTTATNTANVGTDGSFKASSGIDALGGHINNSGVQNQPGASNSLTTPPSNNWLADYRTLVQRHAT